MQIATQADFVSWLVDAAKLLGTGVVITTPAILCKSICASFRDNMCLLHRDTVSRNDT